MSINLDFSDAGQGGRMQLVRPAVSVLVALALVTSPAAPALSAAPAPRAGAATDIRIGTSAEFSRIEFHGAQPISAKREGSELVLRFGRIAAPDMSRLTVSPPRHLKSAELMTLPNGLELRLLVDSDSQAKLGRDEAGAYVHLSAAPPPPMDQADQIPSPARPNPAPASGVVKMSPELKGRTLLLRFPWRSPLGAAVFRRGAAIWVVFDAKAKLDLSDAPQGLPQIGRMTVVQGDTYSAVRIAAPSTTLASASAEGGVWTIALGPGVQEMPAPVKLGRDDASGPPVLTAQLAGATGVFWVDDPVVGDRFAAVTAVGPAKGLFDRHDFIDTVLLASSQGLALEANADDLSVAAGEDLVRISRPRGMKISSGVQAAAQSSPIGLPQPATLPGLVDFERWSQTGQGGFLRRYNDLTSAAADETAKGKGAPSQVRMALARFLVGSELSYEAIGLLNMIAAADPRMLNDAEFRGLRGAARVMAGRFRDAQADFSTPVVSDDPASALWRGYAASRRGDFTGAREQFAAGRSAMAVFAPKWRARFVAAEANAALALGDAAAARALLTLAPDKGADPVDAAALQLVRGRLFDIGGQTEQALAVYDQVAKTPYGAVSAPAVLRATELRLQRGQMPVKDAVATLDSLRFRWRGDATELETVRALGRIYLSQGNYRDALDALRSAGRQMPDLPAAVGVHDDLATAFRALFLDGGADGLQPIQALGLFYDFREQTPIGAEGDQMVRKLARRLVDVDLLDQAAELLKYQAENRLDGVPRAEVATDLAMIQLMNRKPEQALIAINSSRTTLLPTALNTERRAIEARALVQLGRYDHALEVLGKDTSPDAADIRADIAWKQHNWAAAGKLFEARLGDRWKTPAALALDEETRLIRAGAAYSLAGDDTALTRLRQRFGKHMDAARAPEAMQVALSGGNDAALTTATFSRAVSDADALAGWTARMKQRFREKPAPVGKAAPQTAQAKSAAAKPKA